MKNFLLSIVLLLACFHSVASAQWVELQPGGQYFNSFAVSGNYLFAGALLGGVRLSTDYGSSWIDQSNNLGNDTVRYVGFGGSYLYAATSGGTFRSSDSGSTWDPVIGELASRHLLSIAENGNDIFFGCANDVIRTPNDGKTWVVPDSGVSNRNFWSMLYFNNAFYAATDSGLYVTTSNGNTWALAGFHDTSVTIIIAVGTDLFAGTWGHGVFRSVDSGKTWKVTALNNNYARALVASGSVLYYGTNGYGVFVSTDFGDHWKMHNQGLIDTQISALTICGDYLFAGLSDGTIWRRPLSEFNGVSSSKLSADAITVFPNPCEGLLHVENIPSDARVVEVDDLLGNMLERVSIDAEHPTTFDLTDRPTGVYFLRVRGSTANETRMIIKQ